MSRAAAEADVARGGAEEDVRLERKTPRMTVAVIDIGSNTGRLLVARRGSTAAVVAVRNERTVLGLGHEIECTGTISPEKLEATMACARRYATLARAHGALHIDVIVTAPGRQSANTAELVAGLSHVTGVSARVLSAADEGRYAFEGATAGVRGLELPVGVCDVGGGSTESPSAAPTGPRTTCSRST
jgi:exopolyphosphatase / guanosine-5'-triphosphate,3'-diphosphate pyrophosphatase